MRGSETSLLFAPVAKVELMKDSLACRSRKFRGKQQDRGRFRGAIQQPEKSAGFFFYIKCRALSRQGA